MPGRWWNGWLQLSNHPRSLFPFAQLPVDIQLHILELVLEDAFSRQPSPHVQTVSNSGDPYPVIQGLSLPKEGILTVSREMRALSLRMLYQSPRTPPVYVNRWMETCRDTFPVAPMPSYTVVNRHCLRRARFWSRAVIPLRTCWMGADGEFLALAWMVSEMRQLQRLTLDIELKDPATMLEQVRCNYQAWRSVLDELARLPCLKQVNFTIEAHGRHLVTLFGPTSPARRYVPDNEIQDATRAWLVRHNQTSFVVTHQECGNVREDLGMLGRALTFVYHIVVTRYCNIYNQGLLTPSDVMEVPPRPVPEDPT